MDVRTGDRSATAGGTASGADELASALRRSHDRLVAAVGTLTDEELTGPSYADEWSVAQVLSHLGSGAEIFTSFLDAGLHGDPAPGGEQLRPVWDRWNAKTPRDQVHDALAADAAFLDRLDALGATERDGWRLPLFGTDQDLGGLLRMRLGEHAVHVWDVAVVSDGAATVAADAVALLVDTLDGLVARSGQPADRGLRVHVTTHGPDRSYLLEAGADGARLSTVDSPPADVDAAIRLPAEALLRLVYGRLDAEHTPRLASGHRDLDALRRVFPGF